MDGVANGDAVTFVARKSIYFMRARNRATLLLSSQARIPFYSSKFDYFKRKIFIQSETKATADRTTGVCALGTLTPNQLHTSIMKIAKNPIESCSK